MASALALASHYFAVFLVLPEAAWLLWKLRSRAALAALALPAAVGGALLPLAVRQADHRTEWIESLGLGARIREVGKKWLTGEIAPRATALLLLGLVLAAAACVVAWRRLEAGERTGARLAVLAGTTAVVLPLLVDLAGLHYLISKNVMPALTVLLITLGLLLGARRAGPTALGAGAAIAVAFLGLTVAGAIDPRMQRPDYGGASAAIGPPERGQVVVTQKLGDHPVEVYRPGALPAPTGFASTQVILIRPLPRADSPGGRGPTPAPPPGFVLRGRRERAELHPDLLHRTEARDAARHHADGPRRPEGERARVADGPGPPCTGRVPRMRS